MTNNIQNTFKKVKFNNEQINTLFAALNELPEIKQYSYYPGSKIQLTKLQYFTNKASILSKVNDEKFNAYICLNLGNNYEGFGIPGSKKPNFKHRAVEYATNAFNAINKYLSTSTNPLFSKLTAEIVNKQINYCIIYSKDNDDGYEEYGVEVFLKIHYI